MKRSIDIRQIKKEGSYIDDCLRTCMCEVSMPTTYIGRYFQLIIIPVDAFRIIHGNFA